jgi:hypothetical protein
VVQRSRKYARQSQLRQKQGKAALLFPIREKPRIAEYSLANTYGNLLGIFEQAMLAKSKNANGEFVDEPLFRLPIYSQVDYLLPGVQVEDMERGRRKQIVELIRTSFMKRFESSVYSFERSSARLLVKILGFAKANVLDEGQIGWLAQWSKENKDLFDYINTQLLIISDDSVDEEVEDDDSDFLETIDIDGIELLDRSQFDVDRIIEDSKKDIELLTTFIKELMNFGPAHDDKVQNLVSLIKTDPDLQNRKVMIFTEFSDTARYIHKQLKAAGIDRLEFLDSKSKASRATVLRRFSPYYNGSSKEELASESEGEIDVLIATDVLSEGLNLQDATKLINYDIHWNPVRLMQRIGRVDRRLNSDIEAELKKDYPERATDRGHIVFWNFLPPKELKTLISLWHKVRTKTAYISFALGLESPILRPDDHYDSLKEFGIPTDFDKVYDGRLTETEELRLELQQLRIDHPELFKKIDELPAGSFSGKTQSIGQDTGIFFCIRVPGLDLNENKFTYESGTTEWLLWSKESKRIEGHHGPILASAIRSTTSEQRVVSGPDLEWNDGASNIWADAWNSAKNHLHETVLRKLMMPLDAPEPKLVCWMELNSNGH